jgi:hypothetical protein
MSDTKYRNKSVLLNAKVKPVNRKKARGRGFVKGPNNPVKCRLHQPKNNANSLVSLLDEGIEIKGVSETGDQAIPFEQENAQ